MIKIIAKVTVKENMVDIFTKDVVELIAETRKEDGCISYQLFQDVNYSNEFTFIEEWASADSLSSHMKSEHFQVAKPKLDKVSEKEMDISVCTLVI